MEPSPGNLASRAAASAASSTVSGASGRRSLCAFWLAERRYALPTSLIGELVAVDEPVPVPLAPPAVLGVFSLRGAPVALVDVALALELPIERRRAAKAALVLRQDERVIAAIAIDRMDSVLAESPALRFVSRNDQIEHPAVLGFLGHQDVITVLDPTYCLARLELLKFR